MFAIKKILRSNYLNGCEKLVSSFVELKNQLTTPTVVEIEDENR